MCTYLNHLLKLLPAKSINEVSIIHGMDVAYYHISQEGLFSDHPSILEHAHDRRFQLTFLTNDRGRFSRQSSLSSVSSSGLERQSSDLVI